MGMVPSLLVVAMSIVVGFSMDESVVMTSVVEALVVSATVNASEVTSAEVVSGSRSPDPLSTSDPLPDIDPDSLSVVLIAGSMVVVTVKKLSVSSPLVPLRRLRLAEPLSSC